MLLQAEPSLQAEWAEGESDPLLLLLLTAALKAASARASLTYLRLLSANKSDRVATQPKMASSSRQRVEDRELRSLEITTIGFLCSVVLPGSLQWPGRRAAEKKVNFWQLEA
jgi:hypothetical protein